MKLELEALGVQRISGCVPSIMGYFNQHKFKFPCFLVFYFSRTCLIKPLKRPRPPIVKVTLTKLVPVLRKHKVEGWLIFSPVLYELRWLLPDSPEVRAVLFGLKTGEPLSISWPVTKDWLCFSDGKFGRGVSPSEALIGAGAEPTVEFIYRNLKRDKWI